MKGRQGLAALRLALGCCLLLLDSSSVRGQAASSGSGIVINEVMPSNTDTLKDSSGGSPAWLELYNGGSSAVNLGGYSLSEQADGGGGWAFPSTSISRGQYLIVFLSKKNSTNPSELHASFGLGSEDTFVGLFDSGGNLVSGVDIPVGLPTDTSFGIIGSVGAVTAQEGPSGPRYAVLASPTPGAPNSGAKQGLGPLILDTTKSGKAQPDGSADVPVKTTVLVQGNPVASVQLVYVIGYGQETSLDMSSDGASGYTASIPKGVAVPGALVRWFVKATDSVGQSTRDPPFADSQQRKYWGTIVKDPSDSASLPVVELYCQDEKAPFSPNPVPGCSLWVNGSFYDNLNVNRRGVTSLSWAKPKFKVDAGKQGNVIKFTSSLGKVNELNFNSEWSEPGENTFMREPLTWQTFKEMGLEALTSFHTHVRMNGKYYGKFGFVEQLDTDTLQNWGYADAASNPGPLWKSESGEFSNLRWDIPPDQIQFYWKKYTRKGAQYTSQDNQGLLDFARGLSGGGPMPRSAFLFQAVDLPQVVNHMAAQTLLLNQDRCTKNFYIYQDTASQRWSMFAWDVESAYSIDRGLGGQPAPDYCLLACEQWNSPLACDHNHPQDLVVSTPWGLISAQYDIYQTGRRRRRLQAAPGGSSGDLLAAAGRKLLQDGNGGGSGSGSGEVSAAGAATPNQSLPSNSTIPPDYDTDLTKKGPTVTGAPGTYNYLIDAVLSVPRTRAMYVRRLRTLMDQFIASGRLEQLATSMYNSIKDEARRDIQQWGNPGNVDNGYKQLMTEQLPIRKQQLFETYSQSGPIPLIPDSQPSGAALSIAGVDPSAGSIQISNPNPYAVDLSGYSLGGGVGFSFHAGTVVLPGESVYVAGDVGALLRSRPGQGLLIVGPYSGQLLGKGAALVLRDPRGSTVAST